MFVNFGRFDRRTPDFGRRTFTNHMQSLKKIIPQVMAAHGLTQPLRARRVVAAAALVLEKLWGPERAAYIEPLSFKEGLLKMQSASAAALQQLRIEETRFVNELNRHLGERAVLKIYLKSKGF